MSRGRLAAAALLAALLAFAAAACGGGDDGGDDLLASIKEKGVITVSTDPAYPPASELNKETNEYEGFDIDVATEIAKRLDVDIAWETPAWDTITAGNWAGRWDMSVGSMTVTPERAEVLFFTPPYYFTPAKFAVHKDNTEITQISDLDGKEIGACGECTYDFYLQGNLEIALDESGEAKKVESQVADPSIHTYPTDTQAFADLAVERLDAVLSAEPIIKGAIDTDSPMKFLGDPVYYEPLSVAFDRSSSLDGQSLVDEVSKIVEELHEDGTLAELSEKWYGVDLTVSGPSS